MATLEHNIDRPTAASSALDRAIVDATTGTPRFPDGTAFVASDVANLGRVLDRYAVEGRSIAIVYPDGHTVLIRRRQRPDLDAVLVSAWGALTRALSRMPR